MHTLVDSTQAVAMVAVGHIIAIVVQAKWCVR